MRTVLMKEKIRASKFATLPEADSGRRPYRLAIIQLVSRYHGTVDNARQVIDTVGHLCDYILFDSAWVGYEQFIPMMADSSPLLLTTNDDLGIFCDSVGAQTAGGILTMVVDP